MFIDSHCHLNFPELVADLPKYMAEMVRNQVTHALVVSVELPKVAEILTLAEGHPMLYASVGVHPDYKDTPEPSVDELLQLAQHPKVIAIGETGLDYFHNSEADLPGSLDWQRERFRVHIRAAKQCNKPLIIHTRESAADTLRIMEEEGADAVGGVMHCFTESWEVAERAMSLGFYISFSGIVTFKNALALKAVAARVPLERMLIETDSPYLAPMPHRGKLNNPAWVKHVAEEIARLKGVSVETVGRITSQNFRDLFSVVA